MKPIFAWLLAASLLSGCVATTRQYQWGEYEGLLYAAYKDPARIEELTVGLKELIAQLEQNNQKVAPGLYAELGTLYLQAGSRDNALSMYRKDVPARIVWTRFCNSGGLSYGISLAGFEG